MPTRLLLLKNLVWPFEDASSLGFWTQNNDASLFVVGQSAKMRPDGIAFAKTIDGRMLDICEVAVEEFVSMDKFKVCLSLSS